MTTTVTTERPLRRPRRSRYQIPAEVALCLVTLSVVLGFNRVFADASFLGPLVVVVVYTHLLMAVVRRRVWGIALSGLVGLVGLAFLLTYLFFLDSTRVGLPSAATLEAVRTALNQSWNTFQNVTAPAPPETGFLLACAIALYFAVYLADWAAFRLWSAWEAIVPAATLFIFCSLLGSTINRLAATAVFVVAGLAFILLHTIAKKETSAGWLSSDVDRGSAALLQTGALLATCAAVIGVAAINYVPGSDADPILCWSRCSEAKGAGDRFTISPLVEIQTRLVDQANVELFQVESPTEAYWRMTSLDTFDGNSWRSKGRFTVADGDLDAPVPPADNSVVEQKYKITGLARLWIPAAFQPVYVSDEANARFQSDSSTLIVDTQLDTSDGLDYSVKSRIPAFTPEQLRGADTKIPEDVSDRYLDLPSDFSTKAKDAALEKTAGKANAYDKMKALQDWFRSDEFTYNLKVAPGHNERAIDDFLDKKEGYCEQFAGTFAAMARSLGIPARVAVGFTWGDRDATDPNLFHVRGEHAHAWPEVYLGQYGWVAFEPTKQRGNPTQQSWTGVAPGQFEDTGTTPTTPSSSTTIAPGGTTPPTTAAQPQIDPNGLNTNSGSSTPADSATTNTSLRWVLGGLLALLVLVAFYALVVVSMRRSHWRRRRHRAQDASARVRVAWLESVEELELVGVSPIAAETNDEFAVRAASGLPETRGALLELARHTDAATYAADLVDDDVAVSAEAAATSITTVVHAHTTARRRFFSSLNPKSLFRSRRAPRHRATSEG